MTERAESESEDGWDETVDVLCVGTGPGALAYGIFCAERELDVLIVESGDLDPQTAQWRGVMTEDLAGVAADPQLALTRAEPLERERITSRTKLEPFVGEDLRQWSACCLASPFGVMFTEVPDLEPMRADGGRSITAGVVGPWRVEGRAGAGLACWLREHAEGLFAPVDDTLDGLVIADGRIAGVALRTADGPRRIAATSGIAIAVGSTPDAWPEQPELDGLAVDVAVVGRTAGRFARVELFRR